MAKPHWIPTRLSPAPTRKLARKILAARASMLPISVLLVSGAIGAAYAQDVDGDARQASRGVDTIVVTARQREESLQETPLSIGALGGATIEKIGADVITDLDARIPSLQFGNTSIRLQRYTGIRGVGDYSRNPGYDNRAGIYLDGVLMGRSASTDYPVFDIAQVEVLRGPQGTLFGKDALTGVINITTVKPQFENEMRAKLAAGSRRLLSGSASVNTVVTDEIAVRLSVTGHTQRGYYTNDFDGSRPGGNTMVGGRGQLRWLATPNTTVDANFDIVRDEEIVLLGGTPRTGPGVAFSDGAYTFSYNNTTRRERDIFGVSLTVQHEIDDYALTSITAYRESDNKMTGNDFDLSPVEQGSNSFDDKSDAFSQELRLASPGDRPFNYVVGAFYYDQNASSFWDSTLGPDFPVSVQVIDDSSVDLRLFAFFGHATWQPTDFLTLDGGLRYNNTKKNLRYEQISDFFANLIGFVSVPLTMDEIKEDSVDPLASVTVSVIPDIYVYATYSTGKRPGGWNADIVQNADLRFNSESGKNYEIGIKTELFDRHLRLNATAYKMEFDDFQVTQLGRGADPMDPVTPRLTNAGEVTSKGVEVDFEAVFGNLSLIGGGAYNDAVYDSFKDGGGPGVDYDGNRLIEAPKWTASVTGVYDLALNQDWDASASLTYTYKDGTFSDPSNAPEFKQGAYNMLNGRVVLARSDSSFQIALFGRNLTDVRYNEAAFASALNYQYVALNEPRVLGVEISVSN